MNEDTTSNPYSMFETDPDLEKNGIKVDYGHFWWVIARAGGANRRWERAIERVTRPLRRAIATETLENEVGKEALRKAFVEACVIGWGSKKHGDGVMVGKDNEPITFTKENVAKQLTDLDWLFQDLRETANKAALYRKVLQEHDEKNS